MRTLFTLFAIALLGCSEQIKAEPTPDSGPPKNDAAIEAGVDAGPQINPGYKSGMRIRALVTKGGTLPPSPDGSEQVTGWFDTKRSERCAWASASDGYWRCLPADFERPSEIYFEASNCYDGPVVALSGTAAFQKYVLVPQTPHGRTHLAVHTLSGATKTGTIYEATPEGCVAHTISGSGGLRFYAIGPAVDPMEFQYGDENKE
jgi:hypothetical protein